MMLKWFLYFGFLCLECSAYKILVVFPVPGTSHAILGEAYVRHLVAAGHEVTYITPVVHNKLTPNLRVVDSSDNFKSNSLEDFCNVEKIMKGAVDVKDMNLVKNVFIGIANATVMNPRVKRLLEDPNETFDAVIAEWMYTEIYSGFSMVFGCPLIWSSSLDPHAMVLSLIDEVPNPAYTADHMSSEHPPFTFWQRVNELWTLIKTMNIIRSLSAKESQMYEEAFGPVAKRRGVEFVPLNEMKFKGSLMMGNSHVSFGQPLSIPQNYKSILGYHIAEKTAPLPENIKIIMDNATHGVIYFSMGSNLKSKSFPMELKRDLLEMFQSLPQTVIWKYEEALPGLPRNVHIVSWAPQQSVLAHPNCVLFIGHGGLLSTTEAIHFAVPMIGIPAFADQFLNMDRVARKGFGRVVNLDTNFTKNMKDALEDVLSNPRYSQKAKEISYTYHHRPVSPQKELVHWVEHVVTTGGAPHLKSIALQVPLYQKLYLDLIAVIFVALAILVAVGQLLRSPKVDVEKKTKLH